MDGSTMFKGIELKLLKTIFEEYDHAGSIGWLQEIINGEYDLGLLRKALMNTQRAIKINVKSMLTKCLSRSQYDIQYDTQRII